MSKRITLQNILPFVLSGVLVKKSQCEYSLKFQSNWSISYKRKNFERETVCVKFWKFCDSIYITKHSNKRAPSKMLIVWHIIIFSSISIYSSNPRVVYVIWSVCIHVYIREACDIKSFNYHHRSILLSPSLLVTQISSLKPLTPCFQWRPLWSVRVSRSNCWHFLQSKRPVIFGKTIFSL